MWSSESRLHVSRLIACIQMEVIHPPRTLYTDITHQHIITCAYNADKGHTYPQFPSLPISIKPDSNHTIKSRCTSQPSSLPSWLASTQPLLVHRHTPFRSSTTAPMIRFPFTTTHLLLIPIPTTPIPCATTLHGPPATPPLLFTHFLFIQHTAPVPVATSRRRISQPKCRTVALIRRTQ
jgi:hypothetical protein